MPRFLENRLKKNRYCRVQNCQTNIFLSLLEKKYVDVLEVGAGKGYFSYVGAINKKFDNCYSCDIFNDFQINEIKPFVKKYNIEKLKIMYYLLKIINLI